LEKKNVNSIKETFGGVGSNPVTEIGAIFGVICRKMVYLAQL